MIRKRDAWPLGAVGFILAVTASWWGLALWQVPGAPEWLERARTVCFNVTESGLPDAKGWLLLLGQPPTMLALLLVGWGREVRESMRRLASTAAGRGLLAGVAGLTVCGFALAAVHVAEARVPDVALAEPVASGTAPPLDRPWPEAAGLVDQSGRPFALERLGGRPALVTFAFGHCRTVCPLVVHQARAARDRLDADVAIVVLTLDPWRDTPTRLEPLARQFELDPARDHLVGGEVAAVEAALDAWDIRRERDGRTGDIVHPAATYLVQADGSVAYRTGGTLNEILSFADRLEWRPRTQ